MVSALFADLAEKGRKVSDDSRQITQLLREIPQRPQAVEQLLPLVYGQLRQLAQQHLQQERAGHTWQPTALVHEVYLKLFTKGECSWESRQHFFRVAARAMRNLLVDHARQKGSQKRGGGVRPLPLDAIDVALQDDAGQIVALDEALQQLATEDERAAELVELRFFAGLSLEEITAALKISERTVMRDWAFARARLFEILNNS